MSSQEKEKPKPEGWLKTEKVDGKSFDVIVLKDGTFWANLGEDIYDDAQRLHAPSLKKLLEKAREHLRKSNRPAIEATLLERSSWRSEKDVIVDVLLTGVHAGNGNILYRDQGGTHQSYSQHFYRKLTAEEKAEYLRLRREEKEAEKRRERWEQERVLDAQATLQAGKPVLETPAPPEEEEEESGDADQEGD